MMEKSLRQSLFMVRGDFWAVISRPIPAVLYSVAVGVMVLPIFYRLLKKPSKTPRGT